MNIRLIIFSGIVSAVTMFASDEISHRIGGNPSVSEDSALKFNESKIWSFDDCIDWALENNTDLRRNLLSQLQADQNIAEAKDAWLPTVGFSTVQGFVNYPKPQEGISANGYNSSYGINANWTVWEGNLATAVTALKNVLALGLDYDLNIADITLDGKDVNLPLPSKEETFRNAVAWLPGIKSNDLSKEIYDNDIVVVR